MIDPTNDPNVRQPTTRFLARPEELDPDFLASLPEGCTIDELEELFVQWHLAGKDCLRGGRDR